MRSGAALVILGLLPWLCARSEPTPTPPKRAVVRAPIHDLGIEIPETILGPKLTRCEHLEGAVYESDRKFVVWPGAGEEPARLTFRVGSMRIEKSDTFESTRIRCRGTNVIAHELAYDADADVITFRRDEYRRTVEPKPPQGSAERLTGAIDRADRITMMAIDVASATDEAQLEALLDFVRAKKPDLLFVNGLAIFSFTGAVETDRALAQHFDLEDNANPLSRSVFYSRLRHVPRPDYGPVRVKINGRTLLVDSQRVDLVSQVRPPWMWSRGMRVTEQTDGDDRIVFLHVDFGDGHAHESEIGRRWVDVWRTLHPNDPGFTFDPEHNASARVITGHEAPGRYDRVMLQSTHWRPTKIERVGEAPPHFGRKLGFWVELVYVPDGVRVPAIERTAEDDAGCDAIDGLIFASLEPDKRDGYRFLRFEDGQVRYQRRPDDEQSAAFGCEGWEVFTKPGGDPDRYDPEAGILYWERVPYVAVRAVPPS